ncbi:MAG: hypothetical protein IPK16_01040 [Anaerolineales bacterium]|nr:hypothetical protein [Anaerolineales bacterium]
MRASVLVLVTLLGAAVIARSDLPGSEVIWRAIDTKIAHWDWDLLGWETAAIRSKVNAQFLQPVAGMNEEGRNALVQEYLNRSQQIAQTENALGTLYADQVHQDKTQISQLEARLQGLKAQQALVQPAVEQIVEQQIAHELQKTGIQFWGQIFPPVWFTFSEPPRKLVVSPRDRIDTVYWGMLDPMLPPDERERIEDTILRDQGLSAYVTNIGGLGAYPTLVVDRASLPWVLSTVAHEWVHNYLTLFPLGFNYGVNAETTILNETIADIVGDEVGARALATYYPELVREHPGKDEPAPTSSQHDDTPI